MQFENKILRLNDVEYTLDLPIIDAATDGERVFVVFDYMAFPKSQPAANLVALDVNSKLLWTVTGQPIDHPTAAYTKITRIDPLTVGNFAGFSCVIDCACGKLLESEFTK
ncbi:MAG: hypothetical protein ACK5OB_08750 [Pirellula sp.]